MSVKRVDVASLLGPHFQGELHANTNVIKGAGNEAVKTDQTEFSVL
jgi:hypothetical protein